MSLARKQVTKLITFGVCAALAGCAAGSISHPMQGLTIMQKVDAVSRSITSRDLIDLRDIGGYDGSFSVAPDGSLVAFFLRQGDAATDKYLTGWFVASTVAAGPKAVPLGTGGEVWLMGEETGHIGGNISEMKGRWSPNSQWIAYQLKKNGEVQLWRSKRDGSVQEQLSQNAANVLDFRWSVDGEKIFYSTGHSRRGKQEALHTEGGNGYLFGERILAATYLTPSFIEEENDAEFDTEHVSGLWTYDIQSGKERPATDEEKSEHEVLTQSATLPHKELDEPVRQVTQFKKTASVSWLQPTTPVRPEHHWANVVHMVSEDGAELRCEAAACSGLIYQRPMWSERGDEIYFVRMEGVKGYTTSFYSWNPQTHQVRTILKAEDQFSDCKMAVDHLVCLHESATTPRKIVAINPANGAIRTIVDPNPQFQHYEFSRVENLEWKEAHDEAIAGGHLVYPKEYVPGKRYPMVIIQYTSRGFLRGGVGNEFPIHPLAANGFFVLSFDRPASKPALAGSDIYGREKMEWGKDFWERSVTLSALEVIVDQLDERGLIDPDRVGITGLSDGAETVWYAMMHSKHFAVAAASSGGWSPSWYYMGDQAGRAGYYARAAELLPPGMGGDERWKRISPEFHADNIDVPILVQVADSELVMSAASIGSLMDAEKPIESYVFPNEYHVKWRPKHKLAVYERSIDWLNFWLQGIENSDPQRAKEIERWRAMRDGHCAHMKTTRKKLPAYCQ